MRRWVSLPSHIKIVGVFLCELWDEIFLLSCGASLSFPAEQTEAVGVLIQHKHWLLLFSLWISLLCLWNRGFLCCVVIDV